MAACGGTEPDVPTPTPGPGPDPKPPVETKDTKAPTITVSLSSVNVIGGQNVALGASELKIGTKTVATWKDDISATCKADLELDGKALSSGAKLSDPGKLKLTVTDETGNSANAEITLTNEDTTAPQISVTISEKNVVAGVKVKVEGNQLFFDDAVAATWTDDYSETFTVELNLAEKKINSGDLLFDAGTLVLSVADEFQNKSTAEIALTAVAVFGFENLQGKTLQVDQEVNLLEGLTFADGLKLQKVELEQDGSRSEIANPGAYSPQIPGTISIVFTLARTDGSTFEVKVDNLPVQGIQYQSLSITDLKPADILPIIDQIQTGDKNVYYHTEELRVAESTRIREMMWEYGTGQYSAEEYQELMGRLNTGMTLEIPGAYDNFDFIGESGEGPSDHATTLFSIIDILVNHASFKVVDPNTGT